MNPRATFRKIEQAAPQRDAGAPAQERSWLVFRLGTNLLCASTLDVEGIIERPKVITALPFMPGHALGTFLFRDHTATAISLRKKLKVREGEDTVKGPFIAARIREILVAFWVDEVKDVIGEIDVAWQPMPEMLGGQLFDCYAIRDGEIILHTSFAKLLETDAGIESVARWAASQSRAAPSSSDDAPSAARRASVANEAGARKDPAEGAAQIGAPAPAPAPVRTPPPPDTITVAGPEAASEIGFSDVTPIDDAESADASLPDPVRAYDAAHGWVAPPPETETTGVAEQHWSEPGATAEPEITPEVSLPLPDATPIGDTESMDASPPDRARQRDPEPMPDLNVARIDAGLWQTAPEAAAPELYPSFVGRDDTSAGAYLPSSNPSQQRDGEPLPDLYVAYADAPVSRTAPDAAAPSSMRASPPDSLTFTKSVDAPEIGYPKVDGLNAAKGEDSAWLDPVRTHDAAHGWVAPPPETETTGAAEQRWSEPGAPAEPEIAPKNGSSAVDPGDAAAGERALPSGAARSQDRVQTPAAAGRSYGSKPIRQGGGAWKPRALPSESPEPEAAAHVTSSTGRRMLVSPRVFSPRAYWFGGSALAIAAVVIAILLTLPGTESGSPVPGSSVQGARAPTPAATPSAPTLTVSAPISGPEQPAEAARAPAPAGKASPVVTAPSPSAAAATTANSGPEQTVAAARQPESAARHVSALKSETVNVTIERPSRGKIAPAPIPAKSADSAALPAAPAKPAAAGNTRVHVVVRGDTLSGIARAYLGDGLLYPELARLSRIENPHRIYPGDVVRIEIREARP